MYQALYRKYRPKTLDEVVGQKVIVKTLSNSILNDKLTHALLFTGPRGTGKTSVAKIIAKMINCENLNNLKPCNKCVNCTQTNNNQNTDIIEIDAASNNGVDEIRELRDKVNLVPSYGKYKIYIIDEVHMLTTAAFNALLKTLEEPPKHIIFILATTEPHKIPQTILSRCQRYDFKKINVDSILKRLKYICGQENIEIEDDALNLIAKLSDGGMRDSAGLLDQLTAYTNNKITVNDVNEVYGIITEDQILELLTCISKNNMKDTFKLIDSYYADGKNLNRVSEIIIEFLKNSLIYCNSSEYFETECEKQNYEKLLCVFNESQIYKAIEILLESLKQMRTTTNIKLLFELSIIKLFKLEQPNKIVQSKEEIKIYEEKKEIKPTLKVEKKEYNEEIKKTIEKLKQIRINNTLANFDKKQLLEFKSKFDQIRELLMDPDYSSIVSLILDGELKAKGQNNLLFVYDLKNLEEIFNQSLIEIQKILQEVFDEKLLPIAITKSEWNPLKTDFNDSIKNKKNKYKYIEEQIDINKIFSNEKNEKITLEKNQIEEIFEDMIVYK